MKKTNIDPDLKAGFTRDEMDRILKFILYAPYGSALSLKGLVLSKDFRLEDLGFTLRDGRFYTYDPAKGAGRRVSRRYVEETITDAVLTHPEVFFERL